MLQISPFLIPIVAILAGCAVAIITTISRNYTRSLEIRERIAMIEKGLVPPPEVDPRGFDRAMARQELYGYHARYRSPGRHRRVGIILMGVGFGLMLLIGSVDHPRDGFGVGGFLVVIGLAFLINGLFESRQEPWVPPASSQGQPGPSNSPTSSSDPHP
jgi:hypothetical protein